MPDKLPFNDEGKIMTFSRQRLREGTTERLTKELSTDMPGTLDQATDNEGAGSKSWGTPCSGAPGSGAPALRAAWKCQGENALGQPSNNTRFFSPQVGNFEGSSGHFSRGPIRMSPSCSKQ